MTARARGWPTLPAGLLPMVVHRWWLGRVSISQAKKSRLEGGLLAGLVIICW